MRLQALAFASKENIKADPCDETNMYFYQINIIPDISMRQDQYVFSLNKYSLATG